MLNNCMIDTETWGTQSRSIITTIGAVIFDPWSNELGAEFHAGIQPESAMKAGLRIDASTIVWWLGQSQDARSKLIDKLSMAQPLAIVLLEFRDFLTANTPAIANIDMRVWGNGADFDLALIQQAYESLDLPRPWKYNAGRCFRTLKAEFGAPGDFISPTTSHDALADARAQAMTVQRIYSRLYTRHAVRRAT